jgi:hypothetical protein
METTPNRQPTARAATVHVVDPSSEVAGPNRIPRLTTLRRLAESPAADPTLASAPRPTARDRYQGATHEHGQGMTAPRFVAHVPGDVRRREENGVTWERVADQQRYEDCAG